MNPACLFVFRIMYFLFPVLFCFLKRLSGIFMGKSLSLRIKSVIQTVMAVTKAILEKWMVAQKRHRLSDMQVQMARELGLNPDKLGKIDNHRQEPWKTPLPQFIGNIYFKRFKREEPETVKPLKQILAELELKKRQSKKAKEERRKQQDTDSGTVND